MSMAVVNRTFPLEEAEQVHELLRKNALVGRAATSSSAVSL